MPGSMLKYFSDRGGADHGGQLHWPGTQEGFPFRGEHVPTLKQSETENLAHALDYHSRSFKLWDPEDKRAFDVVMDRIVNGWYMQHKRFDNFVPEQQEYVVRLEWVQIYGEYPAAKHPGSSFDASQQTIQLSPATPQSGPGPGRQPQRFPAGDKLAPVGGLMGQPGSPY